jgi:glyoxylate reductase
LFKIGVDFGHDPKGKILGILGMGRIGQAVAQRALSFDMNIIYHNRTILSEDLAAGIP